MATFGTGIIALVPTKKVIFIVLHSRSKSYAMRYAMHNSKSDLISKLQYN